MAGRLATVKWYITFYSSLIGGWKGGPCSLLPAPSPLLPAPSPLAPCSLPHCSLLPCSLLPPFMLSLIPPPPPFGSLCMLSCSFRHFPWYIHESITIIGSKLGDQFYWSQPSTKYVFRIMAVNVLINNIQVGKWYTRIVKQDTMCWILFWLCQNL